MLLPCPYRSQVLPEPTNSTNTPVDMYIYICLWLRRSVGICGLGLDTRETGEKRETREKMETRETRDTR